MFETEIRNHLSAEAFATCIEIPPVADIERLARRRRSRSRLGAAGLVLVVIAGIGVLVAPDRGTEPGAVVVAQPESDGAEEGDHAAEGRDSEDGQDSPDGQASEDVGQATEAPPPLVVGSTRTEAVEPPDKSAAPPLHFVVPDGTGGFVGLYQGRPLEVRRSEDGDTWHTTATWDIGSRRVVALHHDRGRYAAMLVESSSSGAAPLPDGVEVALTDDFVEWEHVDFRSVSPEAAETFGASLQGVVGFRVTDDSTLVQIFVSPVRQFGGQGRYGWCGSGSDDRGSITISCNGTVDVVADADTVERLGLKPMHSYIRQGDSAFVELDMPMASQWPAVTVATRGDTSGTASPVLVTADLSAGTVWAWGDDGDWTELANLGPDWQSRGLTGGPGSNVLVLGLDEASGQARILRIDAATKEVTEHALPVQVPSPHWVGRVSSGPSGWTTLITASNTGRVVAKDGWSIQGGPEYFFLTEVEGDARYMVVFNGRSSVIERGLFGELRVRRPGTDEVLIELDRTEVAGLGAPTGWPSGSGTGYAGFRHQGWTIAGDPYGGPLIIGAPDGSETIHDDGFAFVDGLVDDGVEIEVQGFDLLDDDLVLYQAGLEAARVAMADVVAALSDQSPWPDGIAEPGDAWLLHSTDGESWRVVWEQDDAGLSEFPAVISGDSTVLISTEDGVGFIVVPLPPGDGP